MTKAEIKKEVKEFERKTGKRVVDIDISTYDGFTLIWVVSISRNHVTYKTEFEVKDDNHVHYRRLINIL